MSRRTDLGSSSFNVRILLVSFVRRSVSNSTILIYLLIISGAGISKENIDRIWDRFYKSDSSRGRDKKGSGLGLSIVKETLLAHNENIDVISTVGVGTEFIFSLPISKSAENT